MIRKIRYHQYSLYFHSKPSVMHFLPNKSSKSSMPKHHTNTGLFISPSGTFELDCATTKKDRAERNISTGRESLKVFFFVLGALAYLQVPPLEGSRDKKWRAQ